jgi:hypothetical protein
VHATKKEDCDKEAYEFTVNHTVRKNFNCQPIGKRRYFKWDFSGRRFGKGMDRSKFTRSSGFEGIFRHIVNRQQDRKEAKDLTPHFHA